MLIMHLLIWELLKNNIYYTYTNDKIFLIFIVIGIIATLIGGLIMYLNRSVNTSLYNKTDDTVSVKSHNALDSNIVDGITLIKKEQQKIIFI